MFADCSLVSYIFFQSLWEVPNSTTKTVMLRAGARIPLLCPQVKVRGNPSLILLRWAFTNNAPSFYTGSPLKASSEEQHRLSCRARPDGKPAVILHFYSLKSSNEGPNTGVLLSFQLRDSCLRSPSLLVGDQLDK